MGVDTPASRNGEAIGAYDTDKSTSFLANRQMLFLLSMDKRRNIHASIEKREASLGIY